MHQEWLSASRLSYRLDYQLLFGIGARAARPEHRADSRERRKLSLSLKNKKANYQAFYQVKAKSNVVCDWWGWVLTVFKGVVILIYIAVMTVLGFSFIAMVNGLEKWWLQVKVSKLNWIWVLYLVPCQLERTRGPLLWICPHVMNSEVQKHNKTSKQVSFPRFG